MADVLIVEDDEATQKALPLLLNHRGYSTELVSTLKAGMEAIKTEPRYLLLDLLLPDGNGLEILNYVKDNKLKTKCAITTGYMEESTVVDGCEILVKPIEWEKLIEFLK